MSGIFDDLNRTEYVIDESGVKVPHSDFDRSAEYYDRIRSEDNYTGDQYADMCAFKDRTIALYDKRWQSARAVIDLVGAEIDIGPATCGLHLYGLVQCKSGVFESPLATRIQEWFDKSGQKVKLKRRVSELEQQLDALRNALRY